METYLSRKHPPKIVFMFSSLLFCSHLCFHRTFPLTYIQVYFVRRYVVLTLLGLGFLKQVVSKIFLGRTMTGRFSGKNKKEKILEDLFFTTCPGKMLVAKGKISLATKKHFFAK